MHPHILTSKKSLKMYKALTLLALLLTFGLEASAQDNKVITTTFEVSGVCEMCKNRIEGALDVKGVKAADYELDTHQLTVTYATKHLTEADLHGLINAVGHDTSVSAAPDEQYDALHHCCKYREHDDH